MSDAALYHVIRWSVLFSVGTVGDRTILLRFSAVLRNVVVTCGPLITPGNCWRITTWPELQPSLPAGLEIERTKNFPSDSCYYYILIYTSY
jgi:hypothetical protein